METETSIDDDDNGDDNEELVTVIVCMSLAATAMV